MFICIKWNSSVEKICLIYNYFFNHLLVSVWTHVYLFYTWGYNTIQFNLMLKLSQLWRQKAPSDWLLFPFNVLSSIRFLSTQMVIFLTNVFFSCMNYLFAKTTSHLNYNSILQFKLKSHIFSFCDYLSSHTTIFFKIIFFFPSGFLAYLGFTDSRIK